MRRVEVLTEVSGRDLEATLTDHTPSEILAGDGGSAAGAPARSVRRATARRASNRRATARSRQGDTVASIIEFLARHPASTAGDLAKGLNVDPGSVSTRLTQLANAGEIVKASHGYSTKRAPRPHGRERPPRRSH